MKKNFLFLISIFLMIGVCGCGMRGNNQTGLICEYLSNKYDESFEIVSFETKNIDKPYDEIICQNGDGIKFSVYIKNEKGAETVVDNYYGILQSENYVEILKGVLDDFVSEYKLFSEFTASYFDNSYDKKTEIKDVLQENATQFFSRNFLFIRDDVAEQLDQITFNALCDSLKEHNLTAFIAIYQVEDDAYARIDTSQSVQQYLPDDYSANPIYKQTVN